MYEYETETAAERGVEDSPLHEARAALRHLLEAAEKRTKQAALTYEKAGEYVEQCSRDLNCLRRAYEALTGADRERGI